MGKTTEFTDLLPTDFASLDESADSIEAVTCHKGQFVGRYSRLADNGIINFLDGIFRCRVGRDHIPVFDGVKPVPFVVGPCYCDPAIANSMTH